MPFIWFLLVGAWLVIVAGSPCAGAEGVGRFTNLGPQLTARTFQAAAFTKDPKGGDLLCAVVRSQPAAKLLVFEVETGALRAALPLPGAAGAWAAVTASDGSVYLGTEAHGKLFRYVPGQPAILDLGEALRGETYVWSLAAGANAEVYGATYPGCRVFRYHPERGFDEPAAGPLVPGEKYARSVAYDAEAQTLFVGVGMQRPHLVALNLKNGTRRHVLPADFENEQAVYGLSLSGDSLLARLSPSNRTLVLDRRSGAVLREIEVTGLYQPIGSPPSPYDGAIYYVRSGEVMAFPPASPRAEARVVTEASSSQAMAWLKGPGPSNEAWLTIFARTGQLVRFHPPSGRRVVTALVSEEEPTVIQSIATAADGRLWLGGYLSGGTAVFDPANDRSEQFKGLSQAEQIASLGPTMYFGLYPRARIFAYDTTQPWEDSGTNPRRIALLPGQSRPVAMLPIPELNLLYIGTVPEYGLLGGALAVWNVQTEKLDTFTPFPRHSITSLAYAEGLVVGGASIEGGLGVSPTEAEGKLFLWDPTRNEKVFGIAPAPGKGIVSGLTVLPDGTVWGFAQGTLFVFDLRQRKVIERVPLGDTDFDVRPLWQDGSMVVHPGGSVYAHVYGKFIRLDPRTRRPEVLREVPDRKHMRPIAMDTRGRIYFSQRIDLWRYEPPGKPVK